MFLDKQLGNGCTWINLDVEIIKNLEDLSEIIRMLMSLIRC